MTALLLACSQELAADSAAPDWDNDGWADEEDCAPEDPSVNPGAAEEPYDGLDDDRDGDAPDDDLDGDGWDFDEDCDDEDPGVHPEAAEVCDGVDQDCDGFEDDNEGLWYGDFDGDGYGDPEVAARDCLTGW